MLTDVFDPILRDLTVTLNGTALTEGTQYAYNQATGAFATTVGVLTVPPPPIPVRKTEPTSLPPAPPC